MSEAKQCMHVRVNFLFKKVKDPSDPKGMPQMMVHGMMCDTCKAVLVGEWTPAQSVVEEKAGPAIVK